MTCYRHPNREAGRRCTRCGRPACSECLVQAAIGSQCVECAQASRPDARTRARYWSARQPAMITVGLIAANLAVFLYVAARDPRSLTGRDITLGQAQLGLFERALQPGGFYVPLYDGTLMHSGGEEWYRLLTSGFVHFGIVHLLFNMYLLYVLGNMIEPMIGRVRFLLVYLASLLGGSALELVLGGDSVAGGASGAVFGLMGLAAVAYWLRGVNPLSTQIGTLLMLNLVLTFVFPGISIGGHLGGVLAGALCGFVVASPAHRRVPKVVTYLGPLAVAGLAIAVSAATV